MQCHCIDCKYRDLLPQLQIVDASKEQERVRSTSDNMCAPNILNTVAYNVYNQSVYNYVSHIVLFSRYYHGVFFPLSLAAG